MKITTEVAVEDESAELITSGYLMNAEIETRGDAERIMIIGNSMIAAARLLFARSGIDEKQRLDLYEEFWKPIVRNGVAA